MGILRMQGGREGEEEINPTRGIRGRGEKKNGCYIDNRMDYSRKLVEVCEILDLGGGD